MELNAVAPDSIANDHFDLVVIGSGFGSSFFLSKALQRNNLRTLVIEWGDFHSHEWQLANGRNSAIATEETYVTDSKKPWAFTIGFGGGLNCWFGQTPRLHPTDFRLRSLYGRGTDWPLTYDDLEPFYCEAEGIMSISGDPDMTAVFPRSAPYPQPPHRMTSVDRLMKAAQPDAHFVIPTARARIATEHRPACCASLRCRICPTGAKFTAHNGFQHVYSDHKLQICLNSRVLRLESNANAVRGLVFESGGKEYRVSGDLFVLGANAIHSPAILLQSDMGHAQTGAGLHECWSVGVEVQLNGLDHFDGSTIVTGLNYALYDGSFRSQASGALLYFANEWTYALRRERKRWRQTLPLVVTCEELPEPSNGVSVDRQHPSGRPRVSYIGPGPYTQKGHERALALLPSLLSPLPVERILIREKLRGTESHLQGTLRMGTDPATSVVDDRLVHHRWRNLVVVGTAVFPTCSCANPSLTAAALSLRSASLVLGSSANRLRG